MYYEIRTYTFLPLMMGDWLTMYTADGLALQKQHLGILVGVFTTDVGDLSQVVHIWGYESLDDRIARRDRLAADSRWQAFGRRVKDAKLLLRMESSMLRPTAFSPLQ